jgi:hypothetical protein
VLVKIDGNEQLECISENGNGHGSFSDCALGPEPHVFWTNQLGRISFSLPVTSSLSLPALMLQTEFMDQDEWYYFYCSFNDQDRFSC